MKKWLAACLLAMALLFVATTAMAGHTRLNGDYCEGNSFQLRKIEKDYHTLYCYYCHDEIPENHWSMDTPQYKATCTKFALCTFCLTSYGEYGPHDWGEWKSNGNGSHTRTCKHKSDHVETENCTFSTAPCAGSAACTVCGGDYSTGHDWGEWKPNGNKTHTRVCMRDSSHTETEDCSDFLEADCTSPAMCGICGGTYGEVDPNKHFWEPIPTSNLDGTHTYICCLDSTHKMTEDCSGVDELSCGAAGWCYECNESYTLNHKLDGIWVFDADGHWQTCIRCNEIQGKAPHSFVELADAKHLKSEATCVSGAVYYKFCSACGYQALDTFESGDKNPDNHDLVHHEAKAPTCTEIGWEAYDACSRCDYTTYQELDAPGHSYEARTVQPTCTKKGHTLHTCVRCKDCYTDAVVSSRGHWYGEWSPNGDATSSADCRRNGCRHTGKALCEPLAYRLLLKDAEAYDFTLCPVCGVVSDGARLTLIKEAKATAQRLPRGELVLRIGDLQNGERVLSVGFEYDGRLTQPTGQVEISLPAALLDGYALMLLDADGAETALSYTLNGDEATFTLDFTADESPAMVLRLAPVS